MPPKRASQTLAPGYQRSSGRGGGRGGAQDRQEGRGRAGRGNAKRTAPPSRSPGPAEPPRRITRMLSSSSGGSESPVQPHGRITRSSSAASSRTTSPVPRRRSDRPASQSPKPGPSGVQRAAPVASRGRAGKAARPARTTRPPKVAGTGQKTIPDFFKMMPDPDTGSELSDEGDDAEAELTTPPSLPGPAAAARTPGTPSSARHLLESPYNSQNTASDQAPSG